MITGCLYVDLTAEPHVCESVDRKALAALDLAPDGARVVVNVGARRWVTTDAEHWLRHHADRLTIEIQGTTSEGVRAWVDAARHGRGWQVTA